MVSARWPEVGVVNQTLIREAEYFNEVVHEFRLRIKKMMDMRGKVTFKASLFLLVTHLVLPYYRKQLLLWPSQSLV